MGVTAMVSATLVSMSLVMAGSSIPRFRASPNATNANSPPWHSMRPVCCAVERLSPKARDNSVVTVVLTRIIVATMDDTRGRLLEIRWKSISNPTVTKKRPSSIPRKGAISASIWYRYLVSESRTPARKAPRVLLNPKPSVMNDILSTVRSMTPRKASCELELATVLNSGFNITLPAKAIDVRAIAALIKAEPRAEAKPVPPPAKIGVTTNNGTTARS
mmetsp:Transcript_28111/g.33290  ORF Transcript_28111/g.33290 Transcript_28111/m.33290 type:complete len:218 (-) Transcript_28111:1837-2490(-)